MITRQRALIVDRDLDQAAGVTVLLDRLGHAVRVASDEERARIEIRWWKPDLVLLDDSLGRSEMLRALRTDARQPFYIACVAHRTTTVPATAFDRLVSAPLGSETLRQLMWHVEVRRMARRIAASQAITPQLTT